MVPRSKLEPAFMYGSMNEHMELFLSQIIAIQAFKL